MKLEEEPDGSVTVTAVTWWPALASIAFGAAAIGVWLRDPPKRGDGIWTFVIALVAVVCLAGLERGRFAFDRTARRLTWTRERLFRREGGELPFDDIHAISLEQAFDSDSGRRSNARRVDLHTAAGIVPLTTGYSGGSGELQRVGDRIRAVLGHEAPVMR